MLGVQDTHNAVLMKLDSFNEHINHIEGTEIKLHYK
jgi:hypothetical protein